jgi:hypothetical protein
MNNADDLKFEKRASGKKILVLQNINGSRDWHSINSGDRVKLKYKSVNVVVEVVTDNDANVCTGKIRAFESSEDKINFISIGATDNVST